MRPLLELEDARIDVDGAPLVDGVTAAAQDGPVALLGDWHALGALLLGRAMVRRGRVALRGADVSTRLRDGSLGVASPSPPALELDVVGLLTASATLGGAAPRSARDAARRTLDHLELGALAERKVRSLGTAEARVISVAAAVVGAPAIVAFDAPLAGLDDAWARWVLAVLDRATAGREWLVLLRDPRGAERPLLDRCAGALRMDRGSVTARGAPAEVLSGGRRWLVTIDGSPDEFAAALGDAGSARVVARDTPDGGPCRLVVELAAHTATTAVLAAARRADVALLELVATEMEPIR